MGSEQLTAIEVMYKILSICRSFCELNFDSQICSFKKWNFQRRRKKFDSGVVFSLHFIRFHDTSNASVY